MFKAGTKLSTGFMVMILEIAGVKIIKTEKPHQILCERESNRLSDKSECEINRYEINYPGGYHYTVNNLTKGIHYCSIKSGHQNDSVSCGYFVLGYILGYGTNLTVIKQKLRELMNTVVFPSTHKTCNDSPCHVDINEEDVIPGVRICFGCINYVWEYKPIHQCDYMMTHDDQLKCTECHQIVARYAFRGLEHEHFYCFDVNWEFGECYLCGKKD